MRGPLSLLALALSIPAAAQCALTTTFAFNGGGAGNMFDVVALHAVQIDSLDVNLDPGAWDLEVYAVTGGGSWQGNAQDPAAWTLIGAVTGVASAGPGVPTNLPLTLATPVAPATTQGFYVTVTNGPGINYTNGYALGATYVADTNLRVLVGSGNGYPFGAAFVPRIFNGTVRYSSPGSQCAWSEVYGAGCPTAVTPRLSAESTPALGTNAVMRTTPLSATVVLGVTALGYSATVSQVPGTPPGCQLLCVPEGVIPLDLFTHESVLPVPNSPVWIGVTLYAQSWLLDPAIVAPAPVHASNGLRLHVGI